MRVLLTWCHILVPGNNIIPTLYVLYEGYIVSVHRMGTYGKSSVDPGSIQGSHLPISFIRIKQNIEHARTIFCTFFFVR